MGNFFKNPKKIFSSLGGGTGVNSDVQTALDAKVSKAGDTITGTVNAPTATAGTNTTQIATTAFVTTAISNASSTFKNLTADVTSTITTETVLTDLTFPLAINSTYIVRGRLALGCDNTGGVKIGAKIPTGAVMNGNGYGRAANNTSPIFVGINVSATLANGLNTVNSQAGQAFIEIKVVTSSTSGNFEFIFASNTAGQTSTMIAAGSYLEYIKIA